MLSSNNCCDSKTVPIHKLMATALLVLLLLLAVSSTSFTTTDVYYVTAEDAAGQCPPRQICLNLSYYISQSDYYFTSDTTVIFLEGEHSFDREDLVYVFNVHNLTLKGQGQWPVAGAEETVMQSTVIINCTRGRGGFYFETSHNITIEGLTVVNCSGEAVQYNLGVFTFVYGQSLLFLKNSIQHMTGYGLFVHNCNNATITNSSYYHSALCNITDSSQYQYGGGVGIVYDTQYSNKGYTLELSHSNMTKCCSRKGGGLFVDTYSQVGSGKLFFNHLKMFHNKAIYGGGMSANILAAAIVIRDCMFFNGTATVDGGGIFFNAQLTANITLALTDLQFSHNTAGHYGGGVSTELQSSQLVLVVSNCVFVNGTANYGGGMFFSIQSAYILLKNLTLSHNKAGRTGGGIYVSFNQDTGNPQVSHVTLVVSECSFFNGTALQDGGGMYFVSDGTLDMVNITLNNLTLSHNKAYYTGGLAAQLLSYSTKLPVIVIMISNCVFSNGTSINITGGGIGIITNQAANIVIDNTEFIGNNGFELYIVFQTDTGIDSSTIDVSMLNSNVYSEAHSDEGVVIKGCCGNVKLTNTSMRFTNLKSIGFAQFGSNSDNKRNTIQMDNCQFIGSSQVPSVVFLYQVQANITNCVFSNNTGDRDGRSVITLDQTGYNDIIDSCIISDNNMAGITLVESGATFSGHNVIQNNRNTDGAGITLITPAYVRIYGELLLINNTADKQGGGIFVTTSSTSSLLASQQMSIFTTIPCTIQNISKLIFSGNRAQKGGSDMYGAILMGCDITHGSHVLHIGHPNETSWYFDTPLMKHLHFSNTDRLSSMSSDPIMVCFCNITTNLPDCSDRTHHIQTYPGLEINTSIATVGYYGGTSPGDVQVTAQHAKLVQTYGKNYGTINCFQLHILLQNTSSTTALVDIRVKNVAQGLGVSIGVDILKCPIGFTQISGQCQCEQFLDTSNVQCNLPATPFRFLRRGNSWFGYINNTQCITGTTNCPFDYCNRSNVSFDIMAPDRQCVANRTGILCGQCQSHLSIMLGSNHCGTCSNWYLFLLPVFALASIVLVAVLMFLNLSVSVGTINGLLFYANMVKLNEAFFFPNGSVPVVSQFISWLNLDLGIEVCLFDGLDGYWNTWLQFVFPAYLFLLMGGIIVGCRYSVWLCRLCGSHAVPALATLFLMSYTKILLTVTNALSMSQLPCNDSILTVWSVDGNIEYGSGKHLILVVVSCGVLVIGLAYPVLVLCAPLLERYSHKCIPQHCRWNPVAKFKPLLDAYGGPYKDKYRFWTGVTLMVRLTVTVTFSFTSGGLAVINASIITTIVVGILTFWSFTNSVYKKIYVSLLEVFYLLNLFLLTTVSLATASLESKNYQIATIVSVCLSFVVCLVIMAMHLWWNFDLKKIKRRLGFRDRPEYVALPQVTEDEDDKEDRPYLGSPASIVYGSHRGEHQFVLEFPHPHEEHDSSSPVLLAREPLLFNL